MQRVFLYSLFLLLASSLVFVISCAKPPGVVAQSAQTQLPVKRGSLVIISEPTEAKIRIDGKSMDTTPLVLKDIPAGPYRLEMELEHYNTWIDNVNVKDRQIAEVRAQLEPEPVALDVKSEPAGAIVRIDGKKVGTTPYSGWVSANAEHTVFIFADGYRFESQEVIVPLGGKGDMSVALEELKAGEMGAPIIIGGAEMVVIPAGEFLMGSPEGEGDDDEHPQHKVFVDTFYMDKYEVTNAQYKQFMDATGHKTPGFWDDEEYNQPNHPVVGVDWYDAKAYCQWAGKRLPTEAEWEKAARGGLVGKKYPWGDNITHDDANYSDTGGKDTWSGTSPVGSFAPNGYGLYDMAGNVWEWCSDWFDSGYYETSPEQNPAGPSSGPCRVLRGGSWLGIETYLRAACRDYGDPTGADYGSGFRGVVAQD